MKIIQNTFALLMFAKIGFAEYHAPMYDMDAAYDERTLDVRVIEDWTEMPYSRQKLIDIKVEDWLPDYEYRVPVLLIAPKNEKAKGFHITGDHFISDVKIEQTKNLTKGLLDNGVGRVKTVIKPFVQMPDRTFLDRKMKETFIQDPNVKYTHKYIRTMTLLRAVTAAYAEKDYFEKGKILASGASKNGAAPMASLIADDRFTGVMASISSPYYSEQCSLGSQIRKDADIANKDFLAAVDRGDINITKGRKEWYEKNMLQSDEDFLNQVAPLGRETWKIDRFIKRIYWNVSPTAHENKLKARGVDLYIQPGTHDWVANDILWGAQRFPKLPVYYEPNGGHQQEPHHAAHEGHTLGSFVWNHFFGGKELMKAPKSEYFIENSEVTVRVDFNGTQPEDGKLFWMEDRAPEGSAPWLHYRIPDDNFATMEQNPKTKTWSATFEIKPGTQTIDFFTNHCADIDGRIQLISSPYTQIDLSKI